MNEVWLIGGWSIPRGWWSPVVDALRPTGLNVRVLELDELAEHAGPWADALAAQLASAPTPPRLVGWSMGAMMALDVLTRPRAPATAGLLVLAGTLRFCRAPDWPFGPPEAAVRALRRAVLRDAATALATFHRQVRAPSAGGDDTPQMDRPPNPLRLAAALDWLRSLDLRGRSPPACPVRWVHGECDAVIPVEAGIESARRLGLAAEVLPGVGHNVPGACGARIRDVLTSGFEESRM